MKILPRLFVLWAKADRWHFFFAWCVLCATIIALVADHHARVIEARNASLLEEIGRLRFQVKYGPARQAFENQWRHHETNR